MNRHLRSSAARTAITRIVTAIALVAISALLASPAHADVSTDDMNKSNNPLTPMAALNIQDYYASSLYDSDKTANSFLIRGALPMLLGGVPQIARVTLPYVTNPGANGDSISGLGDMNIFDIFLMGTPELQIGAGPYLILPTASKDETGAGKWQIGAAGTVMHPSPWGLIGALLTYQHDFAGDTDRPTQNIFTAQPFLIYNLPLGYYLRSVGIWNFDWQTGNYYIPIGFGAGKVWKLESGSTVNVYVEPQWTVAHEGPLLPSYQTLVGINFQFPLGH